MNYIYLIDDDNDHFFFKEAIESINPLLKCEIAKNGKIALETLKATTPLPDIIFLDLNMPLVNGIEFLIHLKKENEISKIPIGILSTSQATHDIELSKDLGAQFFFNKPNNFQVLSKKLQQIL